jgi:hypothetical protein
VAEAGEQVEAEHQRPHDGVVGGEALVAVVLALHVVGAVGPGSDEVGDLLVVELVA